MTTNQLLQERYEDALFALLMDGFAKTENEEVLKESQIKDGFVWEGSATLDSRSQQTIARCFTEQRKHSARVKRRKILRCAVAVIVILALLFTTAFAISDEFRASTMNLIITVNEKFTQIDLQGFSPTENDSSSEINANDQQDTYFEDIELTWIPENFTYYSGEYDVEVIFMDDSGQWIIVSKFDGNSTYNVDTENAEIVEDVENADCTGLFIMKNGQAHYALAHKDNYFFLDVTSSENVPAKTVEKVVNSIVIT